MSNSIDGGIYGPRAIEKFVKHIVNKDRESLNKDYPFLSQVFGKDRSYEEDVLYGIKRIIDASPDFVNITHKDLRKPRIKATVRLALLLGNVVRGPGFYLGLHGISLDKIEDDFEKALRKSNQAELSRTEDLLVYAVKMCESKSKDFRIIKDKYSALLEENKRLRDLAKFKKNKIKKKKLANFEVRKVEIVYRSPQHDARKHSLSRIGPRDRVFYGGMEHATKTDLEILANETLIEIEEEDETFRDEEERLCIDEEDKASI